MTEFEKASQVACAAKKNGAVAGEAADEAATAAAGITANDFDIACMRRAIELARGGAGWTNPNPLVGAVIAKAWDLGIRRFVTEMWDVGKAEWKEDILFANRSMSAILDRQTP